MTRKICLFGGSFDPVHTGHLHLAKEAYEELGLDLILFLPAARSPFKQGQAQYFSEEERLRMLHIATKDFDWAEVSNLDLELAPPSWSWRIVKHFLKQEPDCKLYWLMGLDQWQALEQWQHYDYLVKHLHFIVYHRQGQPQARAGVKASFLAGDHPASSSRMRATIQAKSSIPRDWVVEGTEPIVFAKDLGN